jgi:hypothetical protein
MTDINLGPREATLVLRLVKFSPIEPNGIQDNPRSFGRLMDYRG